MSQTITFAWRNLWRNKRRTLITISSIVFAVIIAAFMRGMQLGSYEKMLNDAIKSTTGHYSIMERDYWDNKTLINSFEYTAKLDSLLKTDPYAWIIAPEITTGCLASSGYTSRGVGVSGVDPAIQQKRTGLADKVIDGNYLDSNSRGILIGEKLGQYLKVGVGDSLVILGQGYMGMTAAAELEILGVFDHPMEQLERRMTFMNLATAREVFFMDGRLTSVAVVLNDYEDLDKALARYEGVINTATYELKPWQEMNKVILQQIESDNFFGVIIIGILYLVIGFGIFGTVLMMVMERRREFSVMMALGLRPMRLTRIVLVETIMMGCIGAVIGLVLSYPVIYYFHLNPIPLTGESAEMYREFNIEPVIEVAIKSWSLISQFAIVLALSVVAALVPVWSISRFDFVAIIRGRQ